ncbi:NAD(P)/FAD-dependent oxidoreductase [Zhongshania borealis]|uniref:NAD(P)/FAD-dependent oxidoreductase n=1 Tax=Zhongshania borealis TaxID=889488 RepID=A0ABP7WUW3_9GAMM
MAVYSAPNTLSKSDYSTVQAAPNHFDVIILGAGASGLMCALTAAQRGRRVLVIEKANKVGKKILMSGGGRCNFTNHFVEADNFISGNPHFCKAALTRYTQWDFISLVERYGIPYEERKHSQLFCLDSAKDILNMLLDECAQAGAEIRTHCSIDKISTLPEQPHSDKHQDDNQRQRYQVTLRQGQTPLSLECHSLIVATGALSIPSLGGSGLGYDIADHFGIALTERQAGLVPFMFSDAMKPLCERLAGLALEVDVSCNRRQFTENLLFTHRGISGPAILQISNYWNPGDEITIDLLPNLDGHKWLRTAKHQQSKSLLRTVLAQKLSKGLVNELQTLWWQNSAEQPLATYSDKQLSVIADKLHCWRLKPSATEGYRTAEVTRGGVDTAAISSKTMEVKSQPGLYFIGEVLDVTGHLGGFNFQWAWSSGYSAGLVC